MVATSNAACCADANNRRPRLNTLIIGVTDYRLSTTTTPPLSTTFVFSMFQ